MIRSPKVSGPNLPTSSRWPGDSIWKQPRVWVERISRNVASSSRATLDRSSRSTWHPVDPGHLLHGVGHRRLHPDAEDVELEQAHRLDVVLVELAHREADPARLDRRAVQQRAVGQHDTAGVQRDVAGQSVEPLDQLEQQVQPRGGQAAGPQLGQLGDGGAGVPGPDVREGLGDRVDLHRRHPQHRAHVADRVPDPVGVHHRHAGHPLAAEPGQDLLVDLGPPGRLHVDVDVGQLRAQRRAEPLHQQAVLHRVDARDAEQVVDHAARPGPARGDPDAEVPDQVAHRGHGQEVRRVAEPGDDVELVVQPGGHRAQLTLAASGVAGGHRSHAPAAQDGARVVAGTQAEHPGLRQVDRPDAEVGTGVQDAPLGQGHRVGQQPPDLLPARAARPCRRHHLLGDQRHLRSGAQVARGRHPVQVPGVEGDQPAGRVEHVDGDRTGRVGVPDGVGQDRGHARPPGQGQHPCGVPGAARCPRRAAVADHLDRDRARREPGLPALQDGQRGVRPAGERGPAHVGPRSEQDDERRRPADRVDRVLGDQVRVGDRQPALPAEVRRRDQPAQPGPAHARQHPAGHAVEH